MTIRFKCSICNFRLSAQDEYAEKRLECPGCRNIIRVPQQKPQADSPTDSFVEKPQESSAALEIREFLEPPVSKPERQSTPVLKRMFEAMLDPRSISWLLMFGGGLAVIGLIIWLIGKGFFENKMVLAGVFGSGTLFILGLGWWVTLKTKYRVAGQALTFLGCVVAPLNLWFYHAQDLISLEGHLWVGGVICTLIYIATVRALRDPLFMYAVECGVTLTGFLLLAQLNWLNDYSYTAMFLMALSLISIHAERAFDPDSPIFSRKKFGLPLFWSGHVQLAAALMTLIGMQSLGWFHDPLKHFFDLKLSSHLLAQSTFLAGALWLLGAYLYWYSDFLVRKIGLYTYIAGFCLVMSQITWIGMTLETEGLIIVFALTSLTFNLLLNQFAPENEKLQRTIPPLTVIFSTLPVLMGVVFHLRVTSKILEQLGWDHETGALFVVAMVVVAVSSRISAYIFRRSAPRESSYFLFLSAASILVAAAGLLRVGGLDEWSEQAPIIMLIPIAYLVAARLWRGHTPERPLTWVAHTSTIVILLHVCLGIMKMTTGTFSMVFNDFHNLMLGLVFAEAAVFYGLAAYFRRQSVNIYLSALASCAALWQFLEYWNLEGPFYPIIYAGLGLSLLLLARVLGINLKSVYDRTGTMVQVPAGRGLPLLQCGDAILALSFLSAFFQGLFHLANHDQDWLNFNTLVVTTLSSLIAIGLVPQGSWKRFYWCSTIGLSGVTLLTLNLLVDFSVWQKFEIFAVGLGILLQALAYISRFRASDEKDSQEATGVGLWLGSILATMPLLVTVLYHRAVLGTESLTDEIVMLTVTILMLLTGVSWKTKAPTLFGGASFLLYLGILCHQPNVSIGVYLGIGGVLIFVIGIVLSIYREKLLELPEKMAKREGIFQIMDWQ